MNYLQKKKLAFMSIVNKVKGFVRTIIGIPPLTLPNCVDEDSVIGYKIYGDSVQDGTPSPDNPIEVVSVGEKTGNILDTRNMPVVHTNVYSPRYRWERTSTGFKGSFIMDLSSIALVHGWVLGKADDFKGKTITVSFGEAILNEGARPIIAAYITTKQGVVNDKFDESMSYLLDGYVGGSADKARIALNDTTYQNQYLTFTVPTDADSITHPYLAIMFYIGYEANENPADSTFEFKDIKVEISDIPTAYEPFGYKIPVIARGKNLIPYPYTETTQEDKGLTFTDNGDGSITVSGVPTGNSQFVLNTIPITGGKQYTLYRIAENEANIKWYWTFYDADGTRITEASISNQIYTVTAPDNAVTIKPLLFRGAINVETTGTIYPMLLEGAITQADYEPYVEPITTNIYLDEPLSMGQTISYPSDNLPKLPTFKGTTIYEVGTSVQPSNMEVSYYSSQKGK